MSACAGSLTDASRSSWIEVSSTKVWLLRRAPERSGDCFRPQEKNFQSISPAWSRWIAPGRIGFMSTQRREDRFAARYIARITPRRKLREHREFLCSPARESPCKTPLVERPRRRVIRPRDGHKLSAIGSPQPAARSACFSTSAWFAAPEGGRRDRGRSGASLRLSAHPIPLPILRVSIRPCRVYRQP